MRDVLTHRNSAVVGLGRSVLESAGIPCFVKNEHSHNLMGASIAGQLLMFDPVLCVHHDEDWAEAVRLVREALASENTETGSETEEWTCAACGESVPPEFGECWKCGKDREPPPEVPAD